MSFPRTVGTSLLESLVTCPRKWWFSLREQEAEKSSHLIVGQAVAAALEAWRRARMTGLSKRDAAKASMWTLMKTWRYAEDVGKTFVNAATALSLYWDEFSDEKTLAAEMTFAIPLPGITHPEGGEIVFESRFDAIVELGGALWVLDDKTTSQLGPTWPQQWALRGQLIAYVWAANELGYPVRGAIVRGLRVKGQPAVAQTAPMVFSRWLLEEWLDSVRWHLQRAIDLWKCDKLPHGVFGPQCTTYGGCEWRGACLTPPNMREIRNA